ncbi:MAG: hypothetical protein ACK439_14600 [Novosphingobium sp.]
MAGLDLTGLVAARQQAQFDRLLADAGRLFEARGAQALCLECPVPSGAVQAPHSQSGWLAQLVGLFAR